MVTLTDVSERGESLSESLSETIPVPPERVASPAAPTSTTKVWIDDSAYPHIVDAILSLATWDVLCAFRRTSKPLLARVDALQGQHIILACDTPPVMNITSPYGRVPGMRDRHYSDWSKPMKKRARWELERSRALLSHTRVVDIIGIGDISLVPIARSLTGVRVLRVRPDHDNAQVYKCNFSASKMVVFGEVGAPQLVLGEWRTVVAPTVEKLVVNIRYHPAQHGDARFPIIVEHFPPSVPTVVVHLAPPRWINALPPWDRDRLQRDRWNNISSSIAGMLARTRREDFTVTVVGLRGLYPGWVGQQFDLITQVEPELLLSIEQSLRQQLPTPEGRREEDDDASEKDEEEEDSQPWPFDSVADALKRVSFLNEYQYADTLSPEEYHLETSEILEGQQRNPPLKEKWPPRGIMGFIGM